jgi:hypothetical protein
MLSEEAQQRCEPQATFRRLRPYDSGVGCAQLPRIGNWLSIGQSLARLGCCGVHGEPSQNS